MNQELKQNKQIIRQFMQAHYSDERLAMLLAHAQSGRLSFWSCCCFIGVATADHALQGSRDTPGYLVGQHLNAARLLPGGEEAEEAFMALSGDPWNNDHPQTDDVARRRLIPIIKAEIRRRDRERQAVHSEVMVFSL